MVLRSSGHDTLARAVCINRDNFAGIRQIGGIDAVSGKHRSFPPSIQIKTATIGVPGSLLVKRSFSLHAPCSAPFHVVNANLPRCLSTPDHSAGTKKSPYTRGREGSGLASLDCQLVMLKILRSMGTLLPCSLGTARCDLREIDDEYVQVVDVGCLRHFRPPCVLAIFATASNGIRDNPDRVSHEHHHMA